MGNWYNYMNWYSGVLLQWNQEQCCAKIAYDDGDIEDQCNGPKYKWKCFLDNPFGSDKVDCDGGYGHKYNQGCPNAKSDCPGGNTGSSECPAVPGKNLKGVDFCPDRFFPDRYTCGKPGTSCAEEETCSSTADFSCGMQGKFSDNATDKPRWYQISPNTDCDISAEDNFCVGQRVIVTGPKAGVSGGALATITSVDAGKPGCALAKAWGVRFCLSIACPEGENVDDTASCVGPSDTDGLRRPTEDEMYKEPKRKEELIADFEEVEHCGEDDPTKLKVTCACDAYDENVTASGNGYGMLCMSPTGSSNVCYSPNFEVLYHDDGTQFSNPFYSGGNKCLGGGTAKCFQGEIPCRTP